MTSRDALQSIDLAIWKEIAGLNLSPSHDRWHIDRVSQYARKLASLYGGDIEVITAAVILHDLGRVDPKLHGIESSTKSAEIAERILRRSHFPNQKIANVLSAIEEHDQPNLTPTTLEGRILKDADFLAGFGSWGVLRIALWAGETKGGIDQVFDRLENRMPQRLKGLEFPESRRIARREMAFSRLFVSLLRREPDLDVANQKGTYIILEGISGSGKNTQAEMLLNKLQQTKIVNLLSEPTDLYKQARNIWSDDKGDPTIQTLLLMADRYKQIKTQILPTLARGEIVVSIRSYLSTIVYQTSEEYQRDLVDFFHQFVPIPDMVIILDLPAEVAYTRVQERAKTQGRGVGDFENLDTLMKLRRSYQQLVNHHPGEGFFVVDASQPVEATASQVWELVRSFS